jgi:hypothetical protein
MAAVGPGWWALLRPVYDATEAAGVDFSDVRQKVGFLEIRLPAHREHPEIWALCLAALQASRSCCESCGVAVPTVPRGRMVWRNHCPACTSQLQAIRESGDRRCERARWMHHAGIRLPDWAF